MKCEGCQQEKERKELMVCTGCNARYYCNAECQRKDWKAGHREECGQDRCAYCGRGPKDMRACMGCNIVVYCSKDCQEKHSEFHKKECKCISISNPPLAASYRVGKSPGGLFGKTCFARKKIERDELILCEIPLAAVLFYDAETVNKMTEQQLECIVGEESEIMDATYYTFDSEELIPSKVLSGEKDYMTQRSLALGKLLFAVAKDHPHVGQGDYFHKTLTGSQEEINVIHAVYERLKTREAKETKQIEEKTVSNIMGTMIINATPLDPQLSLVQMGIGFFPALSMFNHRCNPNAYSIFHRGKMYVYANRTIARGEEIFLDYLGGRACITMRDDRMAVLREGFNFTCRCEMCKEKQDFVTYTGTVRASNSYVVKKAVMEVLPKALKDADMDGYVTEAVKLWKEHKEAIIMRHWDLIALAKNLASVHVMSKKLLDTEKLSFSIQIMDAAIAAACTNANVSYLADGSVRALDHLIDTIRMGKVALYLKGMLVRACTTRDMNEMERLTNEHLQFMGLEQFKMLYNLMKPDLEWLHERPLGLNALQADCAVNRLLEPLPAVLAFLYDHVDYLLENKWNEFKTREEPPTLEVDAITKEIEILSVKEEEKHEEKE